ncbi:MAG: M949_RS01915 family surface polysaccharide biosynthesis protein [Pseudobacter sp.]|uniref:M949_RS01915 family surface polysaccharide biosynthesis protein n=1 Tax=Pseudobacter sp. TaxID=2045420 RepID=UPI003F7FAB6A
MRSHVPILFILLMSLSFPLLAQQPGSVRIWSRAEVRAAFGDSLRYEGMPVYRVYEYTDKGGVYAVLFCENNDHLEDKDTINTKIRAVCLLNDHGGYLQKWVINEVLVKEPVNEKHLFFWNRYSSFSDLDGDGYADPVIAYNSVNINDEYQRLKLIVVYKGKKYAVRAVECILDDCRQLRFDTQYKTLPVPIRKHIDQLLQRIRTEKEMILKEG